MTKGTKNRFIIDAFRSRLLLVICCVVCYANGFRNDYALDDDFAFYQNNYVQEGIKGIPDILTHPYYNSGKLTFDYRPVASITFAIEKEFFGNNPHVSHVVNVILYLLCVLLLFELLSRVFLLDTALAFIIALLFAVHPAHVEVVASIKNREEILSLIFCILAFFSVDRYFLATSGSKRILALSLTIVFVLLSFMSKLTTLPMVAIMAAMIYFKGFFSKPKMAAGILGTVAMVSLIYAWQIFHMANRPIYDLENPLAATHDLSVKLGTTLASLWFYFKFMFWPWPFSFFYGYNTIPLTGLGDPVAIVSLLVHLSLAIYGLIAFFRKNITGFFILAYFISISVYSNIAMPYTGIVSERALFFPGIWFIAAACSLIYQKAFTKVDRDTSGYQLALLSCLGLLITIYGVLDINRVSQWRNTLTLMSADIPHLQNSTLANYFYASVLKAKAEGSGDTALQNKFLSEAKKYFYVTNSLSPAYPYGYFRLGQIYRYDRFRGDSAYYYFKRAFDLNPGLTDVAYQYGRTEYEFGDIHRASQVFTDLYQKIPGDTFTIFYDAMLLLKTGHPTEGHQVNAAMLQIAPTYYQPYYNEGLYYSMTGDSANAAKNYETSVRYGCTDQGAYMFLIRYYQGHGRTDDAARLMRLL